MVVHVLPFPHPISQAVLRFKHVSNCSASLGKQLLLQGHAELFPEGLELVDILLVLVLGLNLGLDTYNQGMYQLAKRQQEDGESKGISRIAPNLARHRSSKVVMEATAKVGRRSRPE